MGIDFFAQKSIFVLVVKIACGIILEEGTYRKVILMQMSFFSLDNTEFLQCAKLDAMLDTRNT